MGIEGWSCYESKAGVAVVDAEGNKFTERGSLQPGMEVYSRHFLTGHTFKAKITALDADGDDLQTLVADDGANLWSLVFEEGYWGYRSGINKRAIRRVKIHGVDT